MARDRNDVGRAPYHSHAQLARKIFRNAVFVSYAYSLDDCQNLCVRNVDLFFLYPQYQNSGLEIKLCPKTKTKQKNRTPGNQSLWIRGIASLHGRHTMSNNAVLPPSDFKSRFPKMRCTHRTWYYLVLHWYRRGTASPKPCRART
jgi:hypothetical protein